MSNQSKHIEDLLNSAKAAMEAVGLPMEKFVSFQPIVKQPTLLFSNSLNVSKLKLGKLASTPEAPPGSSKSLLFKK